MDKTACESFSEGDVLAQLHSFLQSNSIEKDTADIVQRLGNVSLKDVNFDQQELSNLCRLSIESTEWLGVLFRVIDDYSITSTYVSLHHGDSVQFPINKKLRKQFTIQTWLQINDNNNDNDNNDPKEDDSLVIFCLSSFLTLSIVRNKLVVTTGDEATHEQIGVFDGFNFDINTPYHLVLVQNSVSQRQGSKFDLYIDGEFIQSIHLNSDIHPNNQNKMIAKICNEGPFKDKTIDFVNLIVVNEVQPLEWILLSYYLSPEYSGNYRDNNLTETLSYRSKNVFELKLKELYIHSTLDKNGNTNGRLHKFEDFSRQELLKFEQIHSLLVKSGKLNLDQELILLWFNSKQSYFNDESLMIPYNGKEFAVSNGKPSLWSSSPIQSVFYSIGGITIAFKIIESSETNDHLCMSIEFLFEVISKDWRNLKEFEMRNGYDLLATLLKTKKQLIDLKVLDLILKFIGYDYNSPIDSILINPFAYRSLILDFDIWKLDGDNTVANRETFKFLLFQFTVFFQESKYNLYNINKLVKMRVLKRFIQALKFESFGKDMLPVVYSSLLILIKANPSSEIMKSLSLYIIYALNKERNPTFTSQENEPLQRSCGLCALDVLVSYICDSSLVNSSLASATNSSNSNVNLFYKKLAKTISVRWVLLLLDDPNLKVVKLALRLLIRMLSIAGAKYYNNFMHHNGLDILTTSLQKWWDDSEISVLLFSGAFGISQIQDLGSDMGHFAGRLSKRGNRLTIVMPEFLYLINNLLLHGIKTLENMSSKSSDLENYENVTFNLASSLNSLIDSFEITYETVPCLSTFYSSDFNWITGYLQIINRLTLLPENAKSSEILSSTTSLVDRFSNFTIELLFKESVGGITFEDFIGLFNKRHQEMAILYLIIYPGVLSHLVNFKDMLPELFSSQKWLKRNLLKFVDSFCGYLDHFKHDPELYIGFTKVVTVIIEINQGKKSELENVIKLKQLASRSFMKEYQNLSDPVHLIRLTKELLFRQDVYFHGSSMNSQNIAELIKTIYGKCDDLDNSELQSISINALRMILLYRQDDLDRITELISKNEQLEVKDFFDKLLSSSDNEIVQEMKNEKFLKIFKKSCSIDDLKDPLKELKEHSSSFEIIKDKKSVSTFTEDNNRWKSAIFASESTKFFRHIQDYEDNLQFYITIYNKMKSESSRLLFGFESLDMKWVVDSIECDSRMRRRIVPEQSASNYKKVLMENELSKRMDVPENAVKRPSVTSLARSSSISSIELEESFEIIEDPAESEANQEDKNRKVLRSLYVGDKIVDLWNVSQIIGLESVESIFILGNSHLYIVENYFHATNGEIMDIDDAPINERDPYMQLIVGPKQKSIRDKRNKITKSWDLDKLTSVSKRQFLLRDVALEFFFSDGSSFLVTCITQKVRDTIYSKSSHLATGKGVDLDLSQALKLATSSSLMNGNGAPKIFGFNFSNAFSNHSINSLPTTRKWQNGEISNFYYLIIINTLAGRTFNDLTQYPVFPWVIADYTSEELDLNDPKTFRDLTRPMGGQGSQRESTFIERYEALASLEDPNAPPFHYGTHYSSAMIVTHFLIRLEPYVQSYLLLQGGKFDHADRLFYSIGKAWNSAAKENTTDVRELIPEFFYLPEFLSNSSNFDLGKLQDGETVRDVILPPWAKGDPKIFIQKNREALESPYVSSHLHEWIDLIFGFKQNGKAAVESTNVFHHLSYNGAIDLDKIEDEVERRAMTGIIHNFGQTPLQLFSKPHPSRDVLHYPRLNLESISTDPISVTESKSKIAVKNLELSTKDKNWKGRPNIFSNEDMVCIRSSDVVGSLFINGSIYENLHSSLINVLVPFGQRMFLTGSKDGTIHVWKYIVRSNFSSSNITVSRKETMSNFLELKNDSFEFQGVLRGHMSSIIDIKIAPSFNSALSLDDKGNVLLWDLVRFLLIRIIPTKSIEYKVKNISIANDTGNILIASKEKISLLTINGELIFAGNLSDGISSLEFAQSNWLLPKHGSTIHHEYWQKSTILIVGISDRLEIIEILSTEGDWKLNKLKNFKLDDDRREITAVKMILSTDNDDDGRKIGKAEIICGDDKGKVYVWK